MPIPTFFPRLSNLPSRYPQVRTMRDDYDDDDSANALGESDSSTSLVSSGIVTASSDNSDDSSGSSVGIDLSSIPLTGVASVIGSITNALGLTKPAAVINKTTVINPASTITTTLKKYLPYILIGGGAIVVYMIVKKRR